MLKRVLSLTMVLAILVMPFWGEQVRAAQKFDVRDFGGQDHIETDDGKRIGIYGEVANSRDNLGGFNGEVYVMYTEEDTYRTSTDGKTWSMPLASDISMGRLIHADGWFYATGTMNNQSKVYASKDLLNWTSVCEVGWLRDLNNDGLVVVKHGYGSSFSKVKEGKLVGTYDTTYNGNFEPVWTGDDYIIISSFDGIFHSDDLITWTEHPKESTGSATNYNVHDGIYFNGMSVYRCQITSNANGWSNNMGIATTTDGINFTTRLKVPYNSDADKIPPINLYKIGNGIAVELHDGVYYSEDGIKWSKNVVNGTDGTVANGRSYCYDDDYVYTSINNREWQRILMTTEYQWTEELYDLAAGPKGYAAISRYKLMVSPDGINWTEIALRNAEGKMHWRVSYGDGKYVVMVADKGSYRLHVSEDLYNWTSKAYYSDADVVNGATYKDLMISCGMDDDGGVLQTSSNGLDWTEVYKHNRGIGDVAVTDEGILFLDYGENAFLTKNFEAAQEVVLSGGEEIVHIYSSAGKGYVLASKGRNEDMVIYEFRDGQWIKVSDVRLNGEGEDKVSINSNASVYQSRFSIHECVLLGEEGTWQIIDYTEQYSSPNFSAISGNQLLTIGLAGAFGDPHGYMRIVEDPIKIEIDHELLMGMDVAPTVVSGRTLMPVRQFFEAINAQVSWNGTTRMVTIKSASDTIEVQIDSSTATVNGQATTLDTAAALIDGRTVVPVRFISEALGYTVKWDASTRTVLVATK